ncbi:MAG: T9SS type A sorting domain-containing protein [Flavobacteriaceae bacterium]|nr:T9SS type A sorting domain-containing protein [Flavobacteriaceae bacterium]
MKYFYSFGVLLFISLNIHSQATDFVTGLNQPQDLLVYEGELYISERNANRIIKLDISVPDPIPEVVLSVVQPWGLAIDGTELYFSQVQGINKISKIDLSDPNPTPIVIVENVSSAFDLEMYGNELYIAQFGLDRIIKIDISIPNPPIVEVINGIETPYALELVEDDLFIATYVEDKVLKTDLTDPNPIAVNVISNLLLPRGLIHRGYELYIAEAGQSIGQDRISKIDMRNSNPVRETVVSGLYNPTQGLEIFNDILYIAEDFKISKFELPPLLSISNFDIEKITVHPNPASNFIQISGLITPVKYSIYSVSGAVLEKGIVKKNEKISLQDLSAGIYFLILNESKIIKVIKE